VDITPALEQRLHELTNVFLAENAKLNLSAFRTEENCWIGNVLDAVAVLDIFPLPQPLPHRGRGAHAVSGVREIDNEQFAEPTQKIPINKTLLLHAREMRTNPTNAEEILWENVRNKQLGVVFRRQHPLGKRYILDFYCHDAKLGIELDGRIHQQRDQNEYDGERTENLTQGYDIRILRFRNEEILDDLPNVIKRIEEEINKSPPPSGEGQVVGENLTARLKILDLGTGGGFPLLPLALCLPDCTFTGLDSVQKKIDAVERMVAAMHIGNASLLCGRAEVLGKFPAHREQYDVVLCRGVAAINVLLEYAAPFAKVGGTILLWKSLNIDRELQDSLLARAELSCHLQGQHSYELPGSFGKRQILILKKTAKTPAKYPREVGLPKKQPLI